MPGSNFSLSVWGFLTSVLYRMELLFLSLTDSQEGFFCLNRSRIFSMCPHELVIGFKLQHFNSDCMCSFPGAFAVCFCNLNVKTRFTSVFGSWHHPWPYEYVMRTDKETFNAKNFMFVIILGAFKCVLWFIKIGSDIYYYKYTLEKFKCENARRICPSRVAVVARSSLSACVLPHTSHTIQL